MKPFSVSSSNEYEIYLLINVKMPKIVVGILTFISRIHSAAEYKSKTKCLFFSILLLMSSLKFMLS